jgi:rhodanese-related sulfurtransferase
VCIVVWAHGDDPAPDAVLTGDTLFIGDVGRPDLLAAAGSGLTADVMGRQLYHSLHDKLLRLPDSTRVFPAHGAGSACGKQLSTETSSTLGEQRRANYALAPMGEDAFVAVVTDGQPLRPGYFEFDAARNRQLRPLLDEDLPPTPLGVDRVVELAACGAALLDTREPSDFAAGHLRGSVNVGLQGRFAEYVGDVLAPDRPIVLVGDPVTALETKIRLARIGFDRVSGYLQDPTAARLERPDLFEPSSRLTLEQFAEACDLVAGLQLVDVRNPGETRDGMLPRAVEVPLAALRTMLDGLDPWRPTVVYCAGGYRSSIGASVLRAAGFADVSDLVGGYGAWAHAGLRVTSAPASGAERSERIRRATMPDASPVGEVAPDEGHELVAAGALLLDVREDDEWQAGHAPGARLVPMSQVQARIDELPRDRRIVTICRSGGRSRRVTEALSAWGFDAVNLSGGMQAWQAAGLPVVTDDGHEGTVA